MILEMVIAVDDRGNWASGLDIDDAFFAWYEREQEEVPRNHTVLRPLNFATVFVDVDLPTMVKVKGVVPNAKPAKAKAKTKLK